MQSNQNQRGMLAVYGILGIAFLALIASGAFPLVVGIPLLLTYFAIVVARNISIEEIFTQLQQNREPIITRAAQVASDRAIDSLSILTPPYILQDIGLVIDERRRGGLSLRQARFLSLDDESVRPYVVLNLPEHLRQQKVILRFELQDDNNTPQFVYEDEITLNAGENLIIPDYRLRLKNNESLTAIGSWKYHFSIDGQVIAKHHFNMLEPENGTRRSPSSHQNSQRLQNSQQTSAEPMPMTLEELLRQQGGV